MIIEYITQALTDLLSNKTRSFLSLLGIVIGVAVVYTIFSLTDITEYLITQELMGKNGVVTLHYVEEDSSELNLIDQMQNLLTAPDKESAYHFSEKDLFELQAIDGIIDTIGHYEANATASFTDKDNIPVTVVRYSDNFDNFYNYQLKYGSDILDLTAKEKLSLAIVNNSFAEQQNIYHDSEIIGQKFQLNNRIFVIAGVLSNDDSLDYQVYLSEKTYDSIFSQGTIRSVSLKINPAADIDMVSNAATALLNQKYAKDNQYQIQDFSALISQITSITAILSTVMGLIATISLLVAGVGIMNIMYVSIAERTKEIGIKRAIGASKKTIRFQFLIETCTLTTVGGLLGIGVGILLVSMAMAVLDFHPSININYLGYALLFSALLGLFFGYLPAKKAANINIIKAITSE